MPDPILFPDAAEAVATYLAEATEVRSVNTVPHPRPAEFLLIRRVGGFARDLVMDDALIVVEAWSATDGEASDLAQLARAHLLAIRNEFVGDTLVYRAVDASAPANLPDPLSSQSRFTATYTVTVRGSTLEPAS